MLQSLPYIVDIFCVSVHVVELDETSYHHRMEPDIILLENAELFSVLSCERPEEELVTCLSCPAGFLDILHPSCNAVQKCAGLNHLSAVVCELSSVHLTAQIHIVLVQPVALVQQTLLRPLIESLGHVEIVLIICCKIKFCGKNGSRRVRAGIF